jgi:hypothetical protein
MSGGNGSERNGKEGRGPIPQSSRQREPQDAGGGAGATNSRDRLALRVDMTCLRLSCAGDLTDRSEISWSTTGNWRIPGLCMTTRE